MKFTVKLEVAGRDVLNSQAWPRGSPCRAVGGVYEPGTGRMIIYVDRVLEEQGENSLFKPVEMTLWYLLIRHLQHTAPHLTISGLAPGSMDKPTAWEMKACILSTVLSNFFRVGVDPALYKLVFGRTWPLVKTLLEKPRIRDMRSPPSKVGFTPPERDSSRQGETPGFRAGERV
ncbi:hypothetical protein IMZ38_01655 [Thermosphaera chiliense]|uniref:Uncharacterized protein n=1 Tax=Thermosphaera chiliense TaxID=3402707 RepID=A0A7M1USW5_9CREN|nr:hypothetical protein [Thermosphaera aggregans]QOR94667.1 hypothetical protein IMZ38_01655 [Thermosphaera aggregans]